MLTVFPSCGAKVKKQGNGFVKAKRVLRRFPFITMYCVYFVNAHFFKDCFNANTEIVPV